MVDVGQPNTYTTTKKSLYFKLISAASKISKKFVNKYG